MDDDEMETKIAPEELERQQNLERMRNLVKYNKAIRQKYEGVIKTFVHKKNYSQVQLHNALKSSVASDIDARTNDGFFAANEALKPSSRAQSKSSFDVYLAKIRAQLNAVLY
jgi:ribosomal protein S20